MTPVSYPMHFNSMPVRAAETKVSTLWPARIPSDGTPQRIAAPVAARADAGAANNF